MSEHMIVVRSGMVFGGQAFRAVELAGPFGSLTVKYKNDMKWQLAVPVPTGKLIRFLKNGGWILILASVECLGAGCFKESPLRFIVFEQGGPGLSRMEVSAFQQCKQLEWMRIPQGIQAIGAECFRSCEKLTMVAFEEPSALQSLGFRCFSFSGLPEIEIPSKVEVIPVNCFSSCAALTVVTFCHGSRVKWLEGSAFGDTRIKEIIIPASVEVIDPLCFSDCKELTKVIFEDGSALKWIAKKGFCGTKISTISIPASVKFLEVDCLRGTKWLRVVSVHASLPDSEISHSRLGCDRRVTFIRHGQSQ
jgi:hypothetical protein